jgi:hypothetical protein
MLNLILCVLDVSFHDGRRHRHAEREVPFSHTGPILFAAYDDRRRTKRNSGNGV